MVAEGAFFICSLKQIPVVAAVLHVEITVLLMARIKM